MARIESVIKKDISIEQVSLGLLPMRIAPAISDIGTADYFEEVEALAGIKRIVILAQNDNSLFKAPQVDKFNAMARFLHEINLFNYTICALYALWNDVEDKVTTDTPSLEEKTVTRFLQQITLVNTPDLVTQFTLAVLAIDTELRTTFKRISHDQKKWSNFLDGISYFEEFKTDLQNYNIFNPTVILYPMDGALKIDDEARGWNPLSRDATPTILKADLENGVQKMIIAVVRYIESAIFTNTLYITGQVHTASYIQNNAMYYIIRNIQLGTYVPLPEHMNPVAARLVTHFTNAFLTYGVTEAAVNYIMQGITAQSAAELREQYKSWIPPKRPNQGEA